ncbi:MAG TPA: response regulator [Candidatus Aquilonibacter sp.]|nr:response regulator [Candidatus Aquilonibacter sp.]
MISVERQYQSTMDAPQAEGHAPAVGSRDERIAIEHHLVSIVDDDESVRESLPDLLREFGFSSRAFSSAEAFLSSGCVDESSCLILDIAMPGMSGPELQRELARRGEAVPIIFITGHRDDGVRARLLKEGAAGFLLKPFSDSELLAAVRTALQST